MTKKIYKVIFCKNKKCNKRIEITNPKVTTQQYCKECAKRRILKKNKNWRKYNKTLNKNIQKKSGKKYRKKNKGKIREISKKYRGKKKNNKKVKEYNLKYGKIYRKKNSQKKYMKKYGKDNKEKINKRRRERGLNIIYSRKRRAKINSIIEDFSNKEWLAKLEATKGFCPKCGKYIGIAHLTLDHIYPVSRAYKDYKRTGIKGVYTIDDVQPLCRSCNTRKGAKIDK